MASFSWSGVFPALLTPFDKDENLDLTLFETNLKAQIEAGVDGVIIGGSLGEASTLLNEEKKELLLNARNIVPAGFPVLVNIAEQRTRDAVNLAMDAEASGASGLMLLPPMRYRSDDAETVAFFRAVAASTSLPIMIYNNPVDYKIDVTLDMFEELSAHDNIQAVKESTRDITNITRMINRFDNRFSILCGVDTIALEALVSGADGWVAGLTDAFPRETVAIFRLVKAGKIKEALDIYRWFMPLLELDIHPKLVQYIKLAAASTGIGSEYVRAPRQILHGDERIRVQHIIDKALANRPLLPDYMNL